MKKIIMSFLLILVCGGIMAAEELIEKTFSGKVSLITREVKGKKLSGFYIISGKNKVKLPKPGADMDLAKYNGKTVTVVLKGSNIKVKGKNGETERFSAREIVSIKGEEQKEDTEKE